MTATRSPLLDDSFAPARPLVWVADPAMPGAARPLHAAGDIAAARAAGLEVYGSPAGTVLFAGVQACIFERPISATPVWDGAKVLANGLSIQGLAPDGVRASYKVVAIPGQLVCPARHPNDLPHAA